MEMIKSDGGRVNHPGLFLKKELVARGWSKTLFAQITGVTPSHVGYVINGERGITPEFSKRIELATGMDAQMWLQWQNEYDLYLLEKSKAKSKSLAGIPNRAKQLSFG